jgi:hypothetical protein
MKKWHIKSLTRANAILSAACDERLVQINALSEGEAAALNKAEELRHELLRSATELARVQGECDALRDWQRAVRATWDTPAGQGDWLQEFVAWVDKVNQAIRAGPKEET